MLERVIMMASYGTNIGDFLNNMAQQGFFDYALPFLLIFAIVFGLLSQMKLFKENKAVNGIIALAVALMALQFNMVPVFFSEIFPRFGVGLAILLIILILVGLFADPDSNAVMYTMLGVGALIAIVILINTAGALGWSGGYWIYDNWKTLAMYLGLAVVVAVIIGASSPSTDKSKSPLARALRGE